MEIITNKTMLAIEGLGFMELDFNMEADDVLLIEYYNNYLEKYETRVLTINEERLNNIDNVIYEMFNHMARYYQ